MAFGTSGKGCCSGRFEEDGMRPLRNPDVVWRLEQGMHAVAWERAHKEEEYEDLGVLTLTYRGGIHQLNLVGAEIWVRVNGANSVEHIASEVADLFRWDPEEAREAVLEFLRGLESQGWLSLVR